MKTRSLVIISLLSLLLVGYGGVFAQIQISESQGLDHREKTFPYADPNGTPIPIEDNIENSEDIPSLVSNEMVDDNSLLSGFLETFGFNTQAYTGETKALIYVRAIINLLLSLVSFVALGIIIYSFYLMFFTEDTKGIETVKKNLKGVTIALVLLGLSRLIVSFIFNLYNRVSGPCPSGQTRSESDQECK